MATATRHLIGLDYARFALAFAVLVYHYLYWGPLGEMVAGAPATGAWAVFGRFGVHAFFMISGFVIMHTVGGRSPTQFAIARVVRLWPTILVCATVTFAVTRFGDLSFAPRLDQYLETLLFVPIATGDLYSGSVDWAYWSLGIELRFYALVLVCMLLLDVRAHLLKLLGAWMALSALCVATPLPGLIESLLIGDFSGCFIVGALTFALWAGERDLGLVSVMLAAALGLTCLQFGVYESMPAFAPPGAPVSLWLLPIVLWAGLAACIWLTPKPKSARGARAAAILGTVSYPLYLLHQFIGWALLAWIWPVLGARYYGLTAAIVAAAVIAIAAAVALLAEPPLKRAVRAWLEALAGWFTARLPQGLARRLARPSST